MKQNYNNIRNMDFDGRGLKCPLAFVKAKQALKKYQTKVYLFDDQVSLYNFVSYLQQQKIKHKTQGESQITRVILD